MMKIVTIISAAAAIFGAQSASAATFGPVGPTMHVFEGQLVVQKDMMSYTCTARLLITVNSVTDVDVKVQGDALMGSFPCQLIAVTGIGNIDWDGYDWGVTGLTIDPPLSSGTCNGRIRFVWDGGGPRKIDLRPLLSDSTSMVGNSCKMQGRLTSVFPSTLTLTP